MLLYRRNSGVRRSSQAAGAHHGGEECFGGGRDHGCESEIMISGSTPASAEEFQSILYKAAGCPDGGVMIGRGSGGVAELISSPETGTP